MLRRFVLLLVGVNWLLSANGQSLETLFEPIIQHYQPNAQVGMVVLDANTGAPLYTRNAYNYFSPASNTKLFTAAAALYQLKPTFQYKTTIRVTPRSISRHHVKSDVAIEFSGDPSLSVRDFQSLVHQLSIHRIKQIDGDIIVDNTIFNGPTHAPGLSYDDLPWYYAAPIDAVIINGNAVPITIKAANTLGEQPSIKVNTLAFALKIDNQLKTVTNQQAKLCPMSVSVDKQNTAHFSGCWSIDDRRKHERIALQDPLHLAQQLIQRQLKHDRIVFKGVIRTGKAIKQTKVVATHASKPLSEMLKHMQLHSDNIYADSLLKTLGAQRFRQGNYGAGVLSVKATLQEHTDLDTDKLLLADGAGSRYNLITPMQIAKLLFTTYHDAEVNNHFFTALPVNGLRGSLKKRLRGTYASRHVHAKTGSMHDISALSGYLFADKNKRYIFSIVTNHNDQGIHQARHMENALLDAIMRL